jgi:CRISPR-associated protein Cmr3
MGRVGLRIEALDTLFFRDGRPFDGQPRAMSGLPQPQTLAGALRTWLLRDRGCDFGRLAAAVKRGRSFGDALGEQAAELAAVARLRFRGPWLSRDGQPLVPVPAILRRIKATGKIVRLAPLARDPPGWQPPAPGVRPLWWKDRAPTEPVEGFLTLAGLRSLVEGGTPAAEDVACVGDLYDFDRRTGIVVGTETCTAVEGQIYGVSLLVLRDGVTFYAEIDGDAALVPQPPVILPFGGEGRRVRVERASPCDWPSAAAVNGRTMLVLTAPGLFNGWQPPALTGLVSAAVPGHVAVSGWDLARGGPKPNRFAVAAGSVYFLDRPLGDRTVADTLCDGEDGAVGWGTFVQGAWDYA